MAATLKLEVTFPVQAKQPKTATVWVHGAPPKANLEVDLSQTDGKEPFWPEHKGSITADSSGCAKVPFVVSLEGPTPTAVLVAKAYDTFGTYYPPSDQAVPVE